jgi:hypothetical protein
LSPPSYWRLCNFDFCAACPTNSLLFTIQFKARIIELFWLVNFDNIIQSERSLHILSEMIWFIDRPILYCSTWMGMLNDERTRLEATKWKEKRTKACPSFTLICLLLDVLDGRWLYSILLSATRSLTILKRRTSLCSFLLSFSGCNQIWLHFYFIICSNLAMSERLPSGRFTKEQSFSRAIILINRKRFIIYYIWFSCNR